VEDYQPARHEYLTEPTRGSAKVYMCEPGHATLPRSTEGFILATASQTRENRMPWSRHSPLSAPGQHLRLRSTGHGNRCAVSPCLR
jgi:hypothetical protein